MKKLIFLFSFVLFTSTSIFAQDAFDAFFESQKSDEHTMKLNLEGDFINMFLSEELEKEGKDKLDSRIDQVKLLIYDNAGGNKEVVKGLVSSFRTQGYEQLIQLRDKGNKIEVFSKDNGDVITNAFGYITQESDKMILVKVIGEISMKDLDIVIGKMSENEGDN